MENLTEAVRERFWAKVEKGEGCWLWKGAIGPYGHGFLKFQGRNTSASRASWIMHHGSEIPSKLFVCHKCQNTGCVRPDHLYLGTAIQNNKDGNRRKMGAAKLTDHRRGWPKRDLKALILEHSIPVTESGCWIWDRYVAKDGYGKVGNKYAHRVSYQVFNGPIQKGKVVMHSCDVRGCVNPAHLNLGTHAENTRDMEDKNRHPHQPTTAKLTWSAVRDIRSGGSARDMASKYGVHVNQIQRVRRGEGWNDPNPQPRLPDQRIKFSSEVVKDIRSGGEAKDLARKYNISRSHITQLRRGDRRAEG